MEVCYAWRMSLRLLSMMVSFALVPGALACAEQPVAPLHADAGAELSDGSSDDGPDDRCADLAASYVAVTDPGEPPFAGTLYMTPSILTDADPTSFVDLDYIGVGSRTMFDRRTDRFEAVDAHLFQARFGADTQVEVQVNPEFTRLEAEAHARFYAAAIGRVPAFYFRDLQTVSIHAGEELAGGGNQNLLIHTGQGEHYVRDGLLEELFLHEGAHTSLDAYHATAPLWLAAQEADGAFISEYARDNPQREDIAESIGPYLAVRHYRDRIEPELVARIEATIPNRIRYFDCAGIGVEAQE